MLQPPETRRPDELDAESFTLPPPPVLRRKPVLPLREDPTPHARPRTGAFGTADAPNMGGALPPPPVLRRKANSGGIFGGQRIAEPDAPVAAPDPRHEDAFPGMPPPPRITPRPRTVLEEKGFIRGSMESVRRGVETMRSAKRVGRAAAGIDPDTPGFVEELPKGIQNLADSTGKLTGGPQSVRSGLPAKQQYRLDQEAQRHISMQKRFENNPIVDPKSGFFKRGWFSGLESVAGWITNMAAGLDEAIAGAGAGAGIALIGGQLGPQAALPEEVVTIPGAAATGFARGLTAGSAKEWYFQGLGDSYTDMVRAGIDSNAARNVSSVMAVPYAAIEFLSGYLPGIRGFVRVGEKQVRQMAAKQTAAAVMKSMFMRTLLNAPVEMSEEGLQSASNDIAFNLAAGISNAEAGTEIEKKHVGEIVNSAWRNFYESTIPVLMMGFGGNVTAAPNDIRRAGAFRKFRDVAPASMRDNGVRPDIVDSLAKSIDGREWAEIWKNNAVDIDADVAIHRNFKGYSKEMVADILARLKAKYPQFSQFRRLDTQDPRETIKSMVQAIRGDAPQPAPGAPEASGRPEARPAAQTPATPQAVPGASPQAAQAPIQVPQQAGDAADLANQQALEEIAAALEADIAATEGPAPAPADASAPVVATEPPAGETQAGLSPTGETQPLSASGTIPTEITQGQAPIAPPDTDRRTVLQETGDRGQETGDGIQDTGDIRALAEPSAIEAELSALPDEAGIRAMNRAQAVAQAAAEGVRGPNRGATKGDEWAGFTAKDIQDRILKARTSSRKPLPNAVPVQPISAPRAADAAAETPKPPPPAQAVRGDESGSRRTAASPPIGKEGASSLAAETPQESGARSQETVEGQRPEVRGQRDAGLTQKAQKSQAVEQKSKQPVSRQGAETQRGEAATPPPTVKESLTLAKPAKLAPLRKGQAVRYKGQEYFVSGMPRLLKKQGIVEITRKGGSEPKAVRAELLDTSVQETGDRKQGGPEARGQKPEARGAGGQAEQPVVTDTPDGVKVEVPMSPKAEAKVTPKEQKKYFIDQIDAAIDAATEISPARKDRKDATPTALGSAAEDFRANAEEIGTVEIEVPGDGTFTLLNTKSALRKLKARAAAMFPATPPTASAPSKPSGKPSAIAKVGPRPGAAVKPAWDKLLEPFTVKDKNPTPKRAQMVTPLFSPAKNETVATDSRRLVVALGVKIGAPIQEGGLQYSYVVPGYRQNQLPQKQNDQQTVRVADTEQFIRQIRQAKMATEKNKSGPDTIALYAMPDGSVAVASMYAGDGYVSQDVSKGNMIGAYTADFVDEIVTFLRKTGNQAIEIRHRDEESPLVLLGAKEYAVLMPVRGTALNAPDALSGMVPGNKDRFAARQPDAAETDRAYLAAVERGDTETAQRILDEAADRAGYRIVRYHQTSQEARAKIYREGFRIDKPRARLSDEHVPDAIFFKADPSDIGVGAADDSAQIKVRLSYSNPIGFYDRNEMEAWFRKNPEYADVIDELRLYDREQSVIFDKKWDELRSADMKTRDEYRAKKLDLELDAHLERWKEGVDKLATRAREIITGMLRSEGYDAVIIQNDQGSFGRKVATTAVFDPNQIKSADAITRDDTGRIIPPSERFNPERDDIRFAAAGLKAETADKGQYQEAERMEAAGKSRESIWQKTGWWKGPDGKWRFEIDDSKMKVQPELGDTYKNRKHVGKATVDSVSYRQNDDGTYDVSFRKKDAQTTADFITYSGLSSDELTAMLGADAQRVVSGMGEPTPWGWTDAEFEAPSGKMIDLPGIEIRVDDGIRLSSAVDHPELFRAYPQLRNVIVGFVGKNEWNAPEGMLAKTDDGTPVIILSRNESKWRTILSHEIQHAIQDIEGYARGGSIDDVQSMRGDPSQRLADLRQSDPDADVWLNEQDRIIDATDAEQLDAAMKAHRETAPKSLLRFWAESRKFSDTDENVYRRLAGEVEARFVQRRLDMPPAERKATPPWLTMTKMLREEGLLQPGQKLEDALIFRKGLATGAQESRMEDSYGNEREATGVGRVEAGESGRVGGGRQLPYESGRDSAAGPSESLWGTGAGRVDAERIAAKARRRAWGRQVAIDDSPEIRETMSAIRARAEALGAHVVKARRESMQTDGVALGNGDILIATRNTPTAMNEGADHELIHVLDDRGDKDIRGLRKKINRGSRAWKTLKNWLWTNYERGLLASGMPEQEVQAWLENHVTPEDVDKELVAELARPTTGPQGINLWEAFGALRKPAEQSYAKVKEKLYGTGDVLSRDGRLPVSAQDGARRQGGMDAGQGGPTAGDPGPPAARGMAGVDEATAETDRAYLAAVERGDTETAQRIVDEAAKRAGYNVGPVWHWTDEKFEAFDPTRLGRNTEGNTDDKNALAMARGGFWFIDKDISREMAAKVGMRIYLSMSNPKRWSGHFWNLGKNLARIKNAGHDGVIVADAEFGGTSYIAFSPSQIKSADAITRDDTGRIIPPSERFNPERDDIRMAARPDAPGTDYDGARVEAFDRKRGGQGWRVVGADGKVMASGFLSKESAEFVMNEGRARLGEAMEAIAKERKQEIAKVAEARQRVVDALSAQKVQRDVAIKEINELLKGFPAEVRGRARYRLAAIARAGGFDQIEKARQSARQFVDGVLTEAAGQIYMKRLNEILDRKREIVTETNILKASPKYNAFVKPALEKAKAFANMSPADVNARLEELQALEQARTTEEGGPNGEITVDEVQEQYLLGIFGGLAHQPDMGRAQKALKVAEEIVHNGILEFMEIENRRKEDAAAIRETAIEQLKGGQEVTGNAYARAAEKRSLGRRVRDVLRGVQMFHEGGDTFWDLLDSRKNVDRKSGILQTFHEMETDASADRFARDKATTDELMAAVVQAAGADPEQGRAGRRAFHKAVKDWNREQDHSGVHQYAVERNDQGEVVGVSRGPELNNSKMKLLNVLMLAEQAEEAAMQPYNNDPQEVPGGYVSDMQAMVANGYTRETIEQIRQNLGPELIGLGHWMRDHMEAHSRPEVQRITERLFGAVPPMWGKYWPKSMEHFGRDEDAVSAGRQSTVTLARSFMKLRVPNQRDLKEASAVDVFLHHMTQLNHVASHLEVVDLENRVIRQKDFQRTLSIHKGEMARKNVNGHLNRLTTGGEEEIQGLIFDKIARKFSRAVIPSPTVMLKQLTSAPLMSIYLPDDYSRTRWAADSAKLMAELAAKPSARNALKEQYRKEFDYIFQRYEQGFNLQWRMALHKDGVSAIDQNADLFNAMKSLVKWGDAGAFLAGGETLRRIWEQRFVRQGMAHEKARSESYRKLRHAIEQTQQTGDIKDLSSIQLHPVGKLMMLFKTSPLVFTRLYANEVRNLVQNRGPRGVALKNLAALHLAAALFQMAADAFFVSAFDDDDDNWPNLLKNQGKAFLLTPMLGYVAIPQVLGRLYDRAAGSRVYGDLSRSVMPWTDVANYGETIVRIATKPDELTENDWWRLLRAAGDAAGVALGQPIVPVGRMIEGAKDAITDDTMTVPQRIARGIGYGRAAVGQDGPSAAPAAYPQPGRPGPYRDPWKQ